VTGQGQRPEAGGRDVRAKRFEKRQVRRHTCGLGGAATEHRHRGGPTNEGRGLLKEARFADSGLSRNQDDVETPDRGEVEAPRRKRELPPAADEGQASRGRRPRRFSCGAQAFCASGGEPSWNYPPRYNATAASSGLLAAALWLLPGVVLILVYQMVVYRVFAGKVLVDAAAHY